MRRTPADLSGRTVGHAGWAIPAVSVRQIVADAKARKLSP